MQDILVALGIAAAVAFVLMMLFQSAPKAAKGNAVVAPQATTHTHHVKAASAPVTVTAAAVDASAPAAAATVAASAAAPPSSSSAGGKKKETKAEMKKRKQEEAEEDAFVEAELKRSQNGVSKDRLEMIDLDKKAKKREEQHVRSVRKPETSHFTERQVAEERASGFKVVNDSERKKEDLTKHKAHQPAGGAKSQSPTGNGRGKKSAQSGSPMSREEQLDMALRSVLSKRGGRGGRGGGRGGGRFDDDGADFGGRGGAAKQKPADEDSGVVEIKGVSSSKTWQSAPQKN